MAEHGPLPDSINPNYFPAKLWSLVNDPANEAIRWDSSGRLVIINQPLLESQVLAPGAAGAAGAYAFKTSNFSSFVRQLNLYGFKKVDAMNQDRLESVSCHYFCNENFQRNRPELVASLRRFTVGNKAKLQARLDLKTRPPSRSEVQGGGQLVSKESLSLLRSAQQLLTFSHLSNPTPPRPNSGTPMPPKTMKRVHYGAFSSPGDAAGPFKTPYAVCHSCHPNLTTSQILGLQTGFNPPKNNYQAGFPVNKSNSKGLQEKENQDMKIYDANLDKVFQIADEVMQSFSSPRLVPVKTSVVVAAPSSTSCGAVQHKNTQTAVFAVNASSSSVVFKQEEASAPSGLQQAPRNEGFFQAPADPSPEEETINVEVCDS
ncbi:heat shock factor protein 5 isoform X2 [Oryzias melastigma]|uniref:heat shock factor protein 5 isoform X2 n=1 Tax=Oryzias melastigma TaxID=30732 RepID=UPI000CF80E25|nr:heat shock factor protein 5 isoform X2 [Oryzias melastigma]